MEYLIKINIESFLKMHRLTLNFGTHFMSIINCRMKLPTFLFQKAMSRRLLALEFWPLSCQWAQLSVLWMWVAAQPENLHGHQSGAEVCFPRDSQRLVWYSLEHFGRRWWGPGWVVTGAWWLALIPHPHKVATPSSPLFSSALAKYPSGMRGIFSSDTSKNKEF